MHPPGVTVRRRLMKLCLRKVKRELYGILTWK
jgi:hypothetical protein